MKKVVSSLFVFTVLFLISGHAHAAAEQWKAEFVGQSYSEVYIKPEADMTVEVYFKNVGTQTWRNKVPSRGYVALNVRAKSHFQHRFWRDWEHPCVIKQKEVRPGEIATCRFAFRAPSAVGKYELTLELAAERIAWIEGGVVTIPVTVDVDPAAAKAAVEAMVQKQRAQSSQQQLDIQHVHTSVAEAESAPEQISEPFDFRVGLFYRPEPVQITNAGSFRLVDPYGNVITEYGGGTIVTVAFTGGTYTVTTPAGTVSHSHYLRFFQGEGNAESVFELTNFDNRPAWNPAINENKFRGIIEYRHNPATGRVWTINEISLETYMHGIGEIGEKAPLEALKATAIAARGYALDMYQTNTKYSGLFHVANSQSDQLFGGYSHEVRRPNFGAAVIATRGEVVTYEGRPVITPYFSQSKGYTKGWHEVWGGKVKPWLVGVTVPCDEGQRGIGHGVGMSQQASICMAQQGMDYKTILRHFYTGTEVMQMYKE